MNSIKIGHQWEFSGLKTLVVKNFMAPLAAESHDGKELVFDGQLNLETSPDEFDLKDYLDYEYENNTLKITFMSLSSNEMRVKGSGLKLMIPHGIEVKIQTENLPLSGQALINPIWIDTENAPISLHNCEGSINVESENGPIRIHNCRGDIFAKLENGPLSADDICGDSIEIESENGPVKLRQAGFCKVKVVTENGPIFYETQPVGAGNFDFKTENGIVHLMLPLRFSFSLSAQSESGRLKSKLDAQVQKDDDTFRVENLYDDEQPTLIKIETENGLIKLSSSSDINLEFIKAKLDQVKEMLMKVNTKDELDKALEKLNKIVDYLQKSAKQINEEEIKHKVNDAIDKMKQMAVDLDLNDKKTVVIGKVEDISSEIYDGIREGLRNVKAEFDDLRYEHLNADSLKEYINKVVSSPLIKPYLSAEKKKAEKEEIAERSRLKILDMLEKGKITSEEAEKLLKAIGKE